MTSLPPFLLTSLLGEMVSVDPDVIALHEYADSIAARPDICPESGWLRRYMDYAEQQTDAPVVYHLAVGLGVVAAALGNRCYLRLYGGKVFPAGWHVLLGASSYMRKSTAIRIGLNVLSGLEGEDTRTEGSNRSRGIVLPANFSKEGLEQAMQGRGDGVLPAMEFGELLAVLSKEFMAGTKEMLTRWYDGDSSARATAKEQTRVVRDPAVTILGASTETWLEERVKEGDVMGGFLARFNFWPATMDERGHWKSPLANNWDRDSYNVLHRSLAMMRAHRDEFSFSKGARERFEHWLQHHENTYTSSSFPAQLTGFHARIATGVLKNAMCLEAGTERGLMTISDESMLGAIRIAEWLKQRVAGLFSDDLAFTQDAADQRKVMALIRQSGGSISRRDLTRRLKWSPRKFDDAMAALIDQERVARRDTKNERGPATTVYELSRDE